MSKSAAAPKPLSSYDLLSMRLQKAINNPRAQKEKTVLLERLPGDREDDWAQILESLQDTDNVTVAYCDDGNLQVFWTVINDD